MKSYELGLYEKAMSGTLSWPEKMQAAKRAGYDFIEISIDETDAKLERLEMSREERQRLADLESRLRRLMEERIKASRHRLALDSGRLQALSPLAQLGRGYSFVTGRDGKPLESVEQTARGDMLRIELRDGTIQAEAVQIDHREREESL